MIIEHHDSNAFLSMALLSYKTNLKYGFIDLDGGNNANGLNGRVTRWREKPEITGLINIGCYVI
jgi:mannose-1-phosphate guanylyltransferase